LPSSSLQVRQASGADASIPAEEKPSTKAIVVSGSAAGSSSKKEGFGNVVHIVDMAWYTTDIEVEVACSQFGSVQNVKFFEDRSNGRSAGTCIVEFSNHEEAKACVDGLNKHKVGEREVHVSWPGKHRAPNMNKNRCAFQFFQVEICMLTNAALLSWL
jgi:RNA recognition motif-containing protein